MSNPIDWSDLERRGLIAPVPGRNEVVRATIESVAAKKAAQKEPAKQSKRPKHK